MSINRLVIISGASRGIGAAAAIEFNNTFNLNTSFILIARDLVKLNEVKNQIDFTNNSRLSNNDVSILKLDFSDTTLNLNSYIDSLNCVILKSKVYDELIFLYNHGTFEHGSIIKVTDDKLHEKFEINFFSVWNLLTATQILFESISKQFHVNINSSYAINAAACFSVQCCARTSRQMLFKCLALEKPNLRVLNYDPGLVYTEMLKFAYESDEMFSDEFKRDYENDKFVKAEDTMKNLIKIINEDKFESGSNSHYIYYKLN